MVVLESGGLMTSANSPYLQPDYLSPLPTTLDAKKSPLALLAQTCSQIGADSPSSKPLLSALEKPKKSSTDRVSPSSTSHKAQDNKQNEPRLAFKPYEANVLTRKSDTPRPTSKPGSMDLAEEKRRTPSSRKSASPVSEKAPEKVSPAPASSTSDRVKSVSPANSGASPIIRSGLEILQGHPKDIPLGTFKPPNLSLSALSSSCCPPGFEQTNPAFRPPFAGGPFSPHHAAMLAASGYPSAPGPYVSYARVKTASGGEALVPVCKDPYCTGCQFSMHNALVGSCPSGCTQCDHQKYNLAAALSGLVPPPHPLSYQMGRPYVCNWIAGETYCGKRFGTSDELLQHLRTHTASADAASLLGPLRYPNPPLSPLSAARYHPYSKPGLPGSLGASPFSAFNPTLGPYYSPYALYGQRLGAAAVHP